MAYCPDGKSYRRLNAIHLLLIGVAYDLVLRNGGRGERCLRGRLKNTRFLNFNLY